MSGSDRPEGDGPVLGSPGVDRVLYEGGVYRTPSTNVGLLGTVSPTACVYPSFIRNVWQSSALARKGCYGFEDWIDSSMRVLRALERVGVDVEVSGAEHLQELDGGAVIIGNHMSTMETVILPALIGTIRPVTFIIKDSLFRTPIFRDIVETIDAIGVTRTQPRQDLKTVLQEGGDRLGKGTSIVVFPQTTRALDFDPEQFSSIGVKLAQRAKVPIIPLALSTQAWANGRWLKDFGGIDPSCPVRIAFGAPIDVEGRGQAEHQQVVDFIARHLANWSS